MIIIKNKDVVVGDTLHIGVQNSPATLECSLCGEKFSSIGHHSCIPGLIKRIEALEAKFAQYRLPHRQIRRDV
jgi:hypothetical protein